MIIKAARQDERANSPGASQIRLPLEERVRQGVGVGGRTLEQKVGYWLGHILEEGGSQKGGARTALWKSACWVHNTAFEIGSTIHPRPREKQLW